MISDQKKCENSERKFVDAFACARDNQCKTCEQQLRGFLVYIASHSDREQLLRFAKRLLAEETEV